MYSGRIACAALFLSLLCSWQSSGQGPNQASGRTAPTQTADASERIKEVSISQLKDWMSTGRPFTLIDVREDNEWQAGHAAKAIHISRWALPEKIGTAVPNKTGRIVLYCAGGVRSAAAAAGLQRMGYTNVLSLAGGFKNYVLAGLPVEK
jgi:rhodanese-related sulfurtransferase